MTGDDGKRRGDYSRATVTVTYSGAAESPSPLQPLEDCATAIAKPPMVDVWQFPYYWARTPDDELFVAAPSAIVESLEAASTDLVFFGPRSRVTQRELVSFQRQRDGETRVNFVYGGELHTARFPAGCGIQTRCVGSLSGPLLNFELVNNDPRNDEGATFECFLSE